MRLGRRRLAYTWRIDAARKPGVPAPDTGSAASPAPGARTLEPPAPLTGGFGAPFGVGDSSGNIRLNSSLGFGAIRWVARRTGTLSRLWVKTRTASHGGAADSSYYAGTTGVWHVDTYLVGADGLPDLSRTVASETFVPRDRMAADSGALGNPTGEAIGLKLDTRVAAGQELITLVRNLDPSPSINYASLNFLYSATGLQGAQARNERNAAASDGLYGLDPREIVGGSYAGTWHMPGNNYGAFAKFLPTYVQQYADGATSGQPYYSAGTIRAGTAVAQRFKIGSARKIAGVGAFLTAADSLDATLVIDGATKATVRLTGASDQFVEATLDHVVAAPAGSVVRIATTPHVDGALKSFYSDSVFARLMGLGPAYEWSYEGDPARTVALYPLFAR